MQSRVRCQNTNTVRGNKCSKPGNQIQEQYEYGNWRFMPGFQK